MGYGKSKDKYTVYLTFKRVFEENFKFKKNKDIRKKRVEDRINQLKEKEKFSVLVRAKLKKERIHTIVSYEEVEKFHQNLMNIMTLNFIKDDTDPNMKPKKMPIKKMSRTKKRQIKRLRKLKKNKMDVETKA